MKSGCEAYQKVSTMGMTQLDLILAVYRGTIGFLEQAKTAFDQEKFDAGRTACDRARKCVVHLYTTLDMEKGQEIARHLASLYAYSIEQLDLAVASKSIKRLNDIIGVMKTLKEGWEGLQARQTEGAASGEVGAESTARESPSPPQRAATLNSSKRITFSA